MSQSPRCPWLRAVPESTTPSSSLRPQHYIIYFSWSFWAYKSRIWYATLLNFVLLYCFDMLHYHIALICYIAFVLLHFYDMLHCFDILHIATSLLFCYNVTFLWYVTLPHCFDMLHCHITLICYIATLLLFCYILIYMNTYYIARWQKLAKWDECGNMDQHYCTTKISASNNMKHIGHSIKLKSESIQMKFSSSSLSSFCVRGLF
jgi:hypothetical protein